MRKHVGVLETFLQLRLGILHHCPEFPDGDVLAGEADAFVLEQHRPLAVDFYGRGDDRHEEKAHRKRCEDECQFRGAFGQLPSRVEELVADVETKNAAKIGRGDPEAGDAEKIGDEDDAPELVGVLVDYGLKARTVYAGECEDRNGRASLCSQSGSQVEVAKDRYVMDF